jgi:hypothetical protein
VTGPVNDPPPGGPGREDLFDDYDYQLANTGCEVIAPLEAWAAHVAACAPPLTADQEQLISRLLPAA